jgi:uncharacterized protein YcsI (UPF0317 family)
MGTAKIGSSVELIGGTWAWREDFVAFVFGCLVDLGGVEISARLRFLASPSACLVFFCSAAIAEAEGLGGAVALEAVMEGGKIILGWST